MIISEVRKWLATSGQSNESSSAIRSESADSGDTQSTTFCPKWDSQQGLDKDSTRRAALAGVQGGPYPKWHSSVLPFDQRGECSTELHRTRLGVRL